MADADTQPAARDREDHSKDDLKKDATTDESSQDSKVDATEKDVKDNGDLVDKDDDEDGDEDGEGDAHDEDEAEDKPATGTGAAAKPENGKLDADKPDESADDVKDEKPEENGEAHEDKSASDKPAAKKEDTEEDEEVDEEEDGEEDDEEADGEKKEKPAPKKAKKAKDIEGDDDEEDGEEDEEDEVEGEEDEELPVEPQPKKKKEPTEPPVPVPAGKGMPLGHIPNVEIAISRFKIEDLKFLHQFLYNQMCRTNLIKRNIKKFKGYEFEKDSAEYRDKIEDTQKLDLKQLRMLCEMLDLDKRGGPNDLATRVIGFLVLPKNQSPHSRGAIKERIIPESAPGGRPRRSAALKIGRGYSDEEYESDPETKVKRAHRDESADSDGSYNPSGSGQDPDSDFDPAVEDAPVGRRRNSSRRGGSGGGRRGRPKGSKGKKFAGKRGRKGSDSDDDDSDSESESEIDSEEESESGEESDPLTSGPPSKRGRGAASVRGRKPGTKNNVAVKRKTPTPVITKPGPASKTKGKLAKPAPGKKKKSSSEDDSDEDEEEEEEGSEEGSSEEGSDEEQEEESATPAKKSKQPPTDEEIKKYVEQILKSANLEEITMKTVCKQVYSHYPDFDLAHKKDFIKATVKSLISS